MIDFMELKRRTIKCSQQRGEWVDPAEVYKKLEKREGQTNSNWLPTTGRRTC